MGNRRTNQWTDTPSYDAVQDIVKKLIQAFFAQISYSHDSDLTPSGVLLVQWTLVVHKNTHQRC